MVSTLLGFLNLLFTLYSFAIIIRVFLSWFRIDYYHPAVRFLIQITEPLLAPLRRHIPTIGGFDFTPMVALLILEFVRQLLFTLIRTLLY